MSFSYLPVELLEVITSNLKLEDMKSFSQVCCSCTDVIRKLDWELYFKGQTNLQGFEKVDRSFMVEQGRYLLAVDQKKADQWHNIYPHIININKMLCQDNDPHKIDICKYKSLANPQRGDGVIVLSHTDNNGDEVESKHICITSLSVTSHEFNIAHYVNEDHVKTTCEKGYLFHIMLTSLRDYIVTDIDFSMINNLYNSNN